MKIESLKKMGYSKAGEVDGMEIWDNFHSTSKNKENTEMGFIFQFNLALQEDAIGSILATKEILKKMIIE